MDKRLKKPTPPPTRTIKLTDEYPHLWLLTGALLTMLIAVVVMLVWSTLVRHG